MKKRLKESPVIRRNQEQIDRLEKRAAELSSKIHAYRRSWDDSDDIKFINKDNDDTISKEEFDNIKKEYFDTRRKIVELQTSENAKMANEVIPYVNAFIVRDKKKKPDLYPDWLSLKVDDKATSNIIHIQPYIDLEGLLKVSGNIRNTLLSLYYRISNFVSTYFTDAAKIEFKSFELLGIDDYIKNVFRKKIRPRIMKEVDESDCIHSIVFRVKKSVYYDTVQIYPRYKRLYNCQKFRYGSDKIREGIENILKEYGWIEGINYTSSTGK